MSLSQGASEGDPGEHDDEPPQTSLEAGGLAEGGLSLDELVAGRAESKGRELQDHFEVGRPEGDGVCSDDQCPCPNTVIPRGAGYLYVNQNVIDFRRDCPSIEDFKVKRSQHGGVMFGSGTIIPVLMCEEGAKLRGLDLEVAAADARHWWETGKVPFRETPQSQPERSGAAKGVPVEGSGGKHSEPFMIADPEPGLSSVSKIAMAAVAKAGGAGLRPFLYFYSDRCPPCRALRDSLEHPQMVDAFRGSYVVKLAAEEWMASAVTDGFAFSAVPVFFRLDEEGRPVGTIDGSAWGEDTPESMAPVLERFFVGGAPSAPGDVAEREEEEGTTHRSSRVSVDDSESVEVEEEEEEEWDTTSDHSCDLIVFWRDRGTRPPTDTQAYCQRVLANEFPGRETVLNQWRLAGTVRAISAEEAVQVYRQHRASGDFPNLGEPIKASARIGPDGNEIVALSFGRVGPPRLRKRPHRTPSRKRRWPAAVMALLILGLAAGWVFIPKPLKKVGWVRVRGLVQSPVERTQALGNAGYEVLRELSRGDAKATGASRLAVRMVTRTLSGSLSARDQKARAAAEKALSKLGPRASPFLLDEVNSGDPNARHQASMALAHTGATLEVAEALVGLLTHQDESLRADVGTALRNSGPDVLPVILNASKGCLAKAGSGAGMTVMTPDCIPALVEVIALCRGKGSVRITAAQSLSTMAIAAPLVPTILGFLDDREPRVRESICRALGNADFGAPGVAAALMRLLSDESPEVSESAASALVKVGGAAVPLLTEGLESSDASVRERSATVLERIGGAAAAAVPTLIVRLKDEEVSVRVTAAKALGAIGEGAASASPTLIEAMNGDEAEVRVEAGRALQKIGARALPFLIAALKDGDDVTRSGTAPLLAQMGRGQHEATAALREATRDSSLAVRRSAADALRQMGQESVDILAVDLEGDGVEVRRKAAAGLGKFVGAEAVRLLTAALKDEDWGVRRNAADSLERLGKKPPRALAIFIATGALIGIGPAPKAAVPDFVEFLSDPSPDVRKRSARALGWIGQDARMAVPALAAALSDTDFEVRRGALWALAAMGPQAGEAVGSLTQRLNHRDRKVRRDVMAALARIGPAAKAAVPDLTGLLVDDDPEIRRDAVEALTKIGPAAVPGLMRALDDENRSVRISALRALATIGPGARSAVPRLVALLAGKDEADRESAAGALGQIGPEAESAIPALIEFLGSNSSHRNWSSSKAGPQHPAARALAKIGAPAVPTLINALGDDREFVRSEAAGALGEIGPEAMAATSALIKIALSDKDSARRRATDAIERIGAKEEELVPGLVQVLLHSSERARVCAADRLAKIGTKAGAALYALALATKDEEVSVRRSAIRAIGAIGAEAVAAVPALTAVLRKDRDCYDDARRALAKIGAPALPSLLEAKSARESYVRSAAEYAIREIRAQGKLAMVPSLVQGLKHETPSARCVCTQFLGEIRAETAVPALIATLKDDEALVRCAVAQALGEIRSEESVPALIEALKDDEASVRHAAIEALGAIGPPARPAVDALKALMKTDSKSALAASRAMTKIQRDTVEK